MMTLIAFVIALASATTLGATNEDEPTTLKQMGMLHALLLVGTFPESERLLAGDEFARSIEVTTYADPKEYQKRARRSAAVLLKQLHFADVAVFETIVAREDWNGLFVWGKPNANSYLIGYMRIYNRPGFSLRERKLALIGLIPREKREFAETSKTDAGQLRLEDYVKPVGVVTNLANRDFNQALSDLSGLLSSWGIKEFKPIMIRLDPAYGVLTAQIAVERIPNDAWETIEYSVSWDRLGGVTVHIVEKLSGSKTESYGHQRIFEQWETATDTGPGKKPEAGLLYKPGPQPLPRPVQLWPSCASTSEKADERK